MAGTAVVLDVSDFAADNAFFAERRALHILVNNAGTIRAKSMIDVSEDDCDALYDLNVKSAFFVTQACMQKWTAD